MSAMDMEELACTGSTLMDVETMASIITGSTLINTIPVTLVRWARVATKRRFLLPTMNCDRLWSLFSEQTREKYAKEADKAPVNDCARAGN